jgi:hypothetical protein
LQIALDAGTQQRDFVFRKNVAETHRAVKAEIFDRLRGHRPRDTRADTILHV